MKKFLSWLVFSSFLAVLAGSAAWSGPLAPEMRVVASRDRDFIERSGAQTLEELLDTGIVRYFYAGGQTLLVLVDGRPYATTDSDLDTLPLSAIERIELLSGESLGQFGGIAVNGAINVVMRKDFEGYETRALTRLPSKDGGDGWQGSVFRGIPIGSSGGRMTFGVDVLRRQKIPSRSREFSRSVWQEGGSFRDTSNVSTSGNTVYFADFENGALQAIRTVSLGDCDSVKGYAGPLENALAFAPPGDTGCGFAYGDIAWNTADFEQRTAITTLDLPLDGGREFHLYANLGQGKWSYRYAPSVGTLGFTPSQEVLDEINDTPGISTADGGDLFYIGHRFLGHGNRDWHTGYKELDIAAGISGRLTEDLGYEAYVDAYHLDGSIVGNTFVHTDTIRTEINAERYNVIDPTDPENRESIERSSVQEERDFGHDYLGARLSLEGQTFAIDDRKVAWTAGIDAATSKLHSIQRFRNDQGATFLVTEVLGSGGVSYEGERRSIGVFGDMTLPLTGKTDFRIAARGDDYDDVGGLHSYRLSAEHRPNNVLALRSSLGVGDRAPSMRSLYSTAAHDHPYVLCDPGPPNLRRPDTCATPNPKQVTRETEGNPELEPSETKRLAVGAELGWRRLFLDVEWYRLERSEVPARLDPNWAVWNLGECEDGQTSNCIRRTRAGSVTIHDSYGNVLDTRISGVTTRYRKSFGTDWGEIVLSGAWRHVNDAERTLHGRKGRYATSKNMVRSRFEAQRGDVTTTWTVNFREGFRNQSDTGEFDDWLGHDLAVDWNEPLGVEGTRVTAGIFNLTDTSLTVDTADPDSVDGPEAAGWGRTFFLTLNKSF